MKEARCVVLHISRHLGPFLRADPGLTLAIGVAARDALAVAGVENVLLKWPNDLVAGDGKLGEASYEFLAVLKAGRGIWMEWWKDNDDDGQE